MKCKREGMETKKKRREREKRLPFDYNLDVPHAAHPDLAVEKTSIDLFSFSLSFIFTRFPMYFLLLYLQ